MASKAQHYVLGWVALIIIGGVGAIFFFRDSWRQPRNRMVIDAPKEPKARPFSSSVVVTVPPVASGSTSSAPVFWNPDPILRRIMADRNRLGVTTDQIAVLGDLLNELTEKRQDYERQIATVTPRQGGGVLIQVPPYPQQGAAFHDAFTAALTERMGAALAASIETSYGKIIEAENSYFGTKAQEISVTAGAGGLYYIQHRTYSAEEPARFDVTKNSQVSPDNLGAYKVFQSSFPRF